jgi:hypothetical protein
MSETHEIVFSSLAILMGKHQGLELSDEQLFLLLNVEASLPEVLAEALKNPLIVNHSDIGRLTTMKIRPTLEASDDDLGANGEILARLIALFEKLLPFILPLLVKGSK